MVYTNEIIDGVRQHPVIFNPYHSDYRNKKSRDTAWDTLSKELNESRNELRKKWKNIRDCYKKYLRSTTSGSQTGIVRSYKNWQWADSMEFCKPYISLNDFEITNQDLDNNDDEDDQFFETNTDSLTHENATENEVDQEKPNSKPIQSSKSISEKHHQLLNSLDGTDLIFLGYSSIVKSFTPTKQAIVKMKIAQIIMEEELQHAEGVAFQSHLVCKPSSSNGIDNSTTEVNISEKLIKSSWKKRDKQKGAKKRKITSEEDLDTIDVVKNDIDEHILDLKLETNNVLDCN